MATLASACTDQLLCCRRAPMARHAQTAAKRPPGPAEEERPRFKICVATRQAVVPKVPKISQLRIGGPTGVPPPDVVAQKLGDATVVVGLDIETADWVDKKQPTTKGKFGFFHFCHPDNFSQKIVQIGWAMGEARAGAPLWEYEEFLVKPENFMIAEKATAVHGITQETAMAHGRPLRDVLVDLMCMVRRAKTVGARMVVHHLAFDATIIDEQLGEAGLEHERAEWVAFASAGFCTMEGRLRYFFCKPLLPPPISIG